MMIYVAVYRLIQSVFYNRNKAQFTSFLIVIKGCNKHLGCKNLSSLIKTI